MSMCVLQDHMLLKGLLGDLYNFCLAKRCSFIFLMKRQICSLFQLTLFVADQSPSLCKDAWWTSLPHKCPDFLSRKDMQVRGLKPWSSDWAIVWRMWGYCCHFYPCAWNHSVKKSSCTQCFKNIAMCLNWHNVSCSYTISSEYRMLSVFKHMEESKKWKNQ